MAEIKALTFDVGGTVFDWHGKMVEEVTDLANQRGIEIDAHHFANQWLAQSFEIVGQLRAGRLPWMNSEQIHRRSLDDVLANHRSLVLSSTERDDLARVWHRLRAWPDAADAIEQLRTRYMVIVLTIGSLSQVIDNSKAAGISWDAILSCDFLGHYKPDAEAYLTAARMLGLEPGQVMMVAAHPSDLRAAMAAGFCSAFVPRPGEWGPGNDPDLSWQPDFTVNAADFADLASQLLAL